jgi:hypothetical protein
MFFKLPTKEPSTLVVIRTHYNTFNSSSEASTEGETNYELAVGGQRSGSRCSALSLADGYCSLLILHLSLHHSSPITLSSSPSA